MSIKRSEYEPTPGELFSDYDKAVKRFGYDSVIAREAWRNWCDVQDLESNELNRDENTPRPFGDTRSLYDIYPLNLEEHEARKLSQSISTREEELGQTLHEFELLHGEDAREKLEEELAS